MWRSYVVAKFIMLLTWCAVSACLVIDGWRDGQQKDAAIDAVLTTILAVFVGIKLVIEYHMGA